MLDAIRANADLLSLAATVAMVAIWLIYLHLFWKNYRRHLRPSIVINRGAGTGLDARCLVSNMSAEAIFIEGIILVLERENQYWSTAIITAGEIGEDGEGKTGLARPPMHEGPLASGAYVDIGRFQDIVERAFGTVRRQGGRDDRLGFDGFEIWVIANYTAEQRLVHARRRFDIGRKEGNWALRPHQLETEVVRVRSDDERRRIENTLQTELEKTLIPKHGE